MSEAIMNCMQLQGAPRNTGGTAGQDFVDASWILSYWHGAQFDDQIGGTMSSSPESAYVTSGMMGRVMPANALSFEEFNYVEWNLKTSKGWGGGSGSIHNQLRYS
jgi:hypothetical protein